MTIAESIRGAIATATRGATAIGPTIVLLSALVAGCASVISNSEAYYKERPQRPINWQEYLTD